jgi:hypothetical protein
LPKVRNVPAYYATLYATGVKGLTVDASVEEEKMKKMAIISNILQFLSIKRLSYYKNGQG